MNINEMNLEKIWIEIDRIANENPDLIKELNATYLFDINGEESGKYGLKFIDGTAEVLQGNKQDVDCTLSMNVDNFKKLLLGNLNATTAFMTGRLKVKGNIGLALKLENVLKKFSL